MTESIKQPVKVEAQKTGYRQTKSGIVISFTIHPEDAHEDLANMPIGTDGILAFAEIVET